MKVAIVGGRSFNDYALLKKTMETKLITPITAIVSGGAKGADSLAERYAQENGLEMVIYYPDWEKHGRAAGPIRNRLIVDEADAVVAFWDGKSRGTKSTIDLTLNKNKQLILVNY